MLARFVTACATVLALSASPVLAHALLQHAEPRAGSTVTTPPTAVSIDFSEEVEPKFCSIAVTDAHGVRVDRGAPHTDPANAKHLTVDLGALKPGVYTVVWRATSVDTHKTSGKYRFTLQP